VSELVSFPLELLDGKIGDRPARPFQAPKRIQTNMLARRERQLLNGFCGIMPAWVTPDHLTVLGVVGAVISAIGYAATHLHPAFYLLASFGLVLNWFGDSLDGSLARYRKTERPRYGYFVDHSVDVVNNFLIIGGLGLTPDISLSAALFAFSGYLALSIYVFLRNHVSGELQLTFVSCGPTEIRLGIIAFNLALFVFGPTSLAIGGFRISLPTAGVGLFGGVLVVLFVASLVKTARDLARQSETDAGAKAVESGRRRDADSILAAPKTFASQPGADGTRFAV
jgi:phosphatidylglycerophosphate synthase